MSERAEPAAPVSAAQTYGFVCFLSLGVVLLADLQRGPGLLTALKVLVGVLGVLARLRVASVLLLLTLAIEPLVDQLRLTGLGWNWQLLARAFRLSDVLLAAGVLGYVLAHSRLLSLTVNVFPLEPRRRVPPLGHRDRTGPPKRSQGLVTAEEIGALALVAPAAALAGWGLWLLLARPWYVLGLPPTIGRLLVVLWTVGLGMPVVAALLGHWRTRRMSPDEAALHVQDVLWHETRREQRRQNQWLAWSRLPRSRRAKP